MIPNSIVKCWKKCLFFGLKVTKKILIKGSAKMKSTSTPPTNDLPKTLGLPPSRSSRASRLGTKLRGSGMQPITSAPAPPLLPNFHFHFHFCFQLKPLFDPHPAHTHISFHFHFRFQLRLIASLPNYPRQRCRLNICSYIGWIDKDCICQFNQYNNKYWDGGAV